MRKPFEPLSTRKAEGLRAVIERRRLENEKCPSYPAHYRTKTVWDNQNFMQIKGVPLRAVNVPFKSRLLGEAFGLKFVQNRFARKKRFNLEAVNKRFEMINEIYSIRQPEAVRSFIANNNLLVSKISKAHQKIREQFPSENIFLEVYSSPTHPDEKEVLISVATTMSPKEAIGRLDRVDDELWFEDPSEHYVNICLKLEYQ